MKSIPEKPPKGNPKVAFFRDIRNAAASGDLIQDHDRDDARRAALVLSEVGHDGRVRVEQTGAFASFHD